MNFRHRRFKSMLHPEQKQETESNHIKLIKFKKEHFEEKADEKNQSGMYFHAMQAFNDLKVNDFGKGEAKVSFPKLTVPELDPKRASQFPITIYPSKMPDYHVTGLNYAQFSHHRKPSKTLFKQAQEILYKDITEQPVAKDAVNPEDDPPKKIKSRQFASNLQIKKALMGKVVLKDVLAEMKKERQNQSLNLQQLSHPSVLITSYSGEFIAGVKKFPRHEDNKQRSATHKSKGYQPSKQNYKKIPNEFNWKVAVFPLNKLERAEVMKVFRHYLGIGEVKSPYSGLYKVYVGSGNNCQLIAKMLKNKGFWTIVDSLDDKPNLIWTQLPLERSKKTKKQTQKKETELESTNSSQQKPKETILGLSINSSFPLFDSTFLLSENELNSFLATKKNDYLDLCKKILSPSHFKLILSKVIKHFKANKNIQKFEYLSKILEKEIKGSLKRDIECEKVRLVNHVENSSAIGNKKGLLFYINKYSDIFKVKVNDLIPTTVHLDLNPQQTFGLDELGSQVLSEIPNGPWILKPGEQTNRGCGISVHIKKQSLIAEINTERKHETGEKYTLIIQKYIQPFLYNSRKFDIRMWVLWTGQQLWWFQEGYIRTSCKQFSIRKQDRFIHLTNDAVQMCSNDYGKYQNSNKLSFNDFERYLQTNNLPFDFNKVRSRMKELAVKLFRIGGVAMPHRPKQFELFGLDYVIDEKFQTWLIECNSNPSLEMPCSLLTRLVPSLIESIITVVIDPYFPPPEKKKSRDPSGIFWNNNKFKFEMVYNAEEDYELHQKLAFNPTLNNEDIDDLEKCLNYPN